MNETTSTTSSIDFQVLASTTPNFRRVDTIPESLQGSIQMAVTDFLRTSHIPKGVDQKGLYQQTLGSISQATFLRQGGDFWIATLDGKLCAYLLARIVVDIDNRLTYWVSQAWVHKDWRRSPEVKLGWQKIRERAKNCLCSHIVIVSSRSTKAYLRWLGKDWTTYATLLKEDL